MYLRLFVPLFLVCTLAFAGEELVPEANFVPTGLELSERGDTSTPSGALGAFGALGASGGIAVVIEAASAAKNLLPDFAFVRGTDLSWENWISPSTRQDSEW